MSSKLGVARFWMSSAYHSCYVLFSKALSENPDASEKIRNIYKLPKPYACISADATAHALERLGVFSSINPLGLMELSKKLEMKETYKKIKKIVKKNYDVPSPSIPTNYDVNALHHSADLESLAKQLHSNTKILYAQTELARMIVETRNSGSTCSPETKELLENFNKAHSKFQELNGYMMQAARILKLEGIA